MSDCGNVQKVFVPVQTETKSESKPVIGGIRITDKAADKIKLFLQQSNQSPESFGLHISVKPDGCSGKSYAMDLVEIEPKKENGDKIFQHNGATVMIEKTSYFYVTGSELDYTEALTGSGFQLVNPNIKKTCSCGSSFAV